MDSITAQIRQTISGKIEGTLASTSGLTAAATDLPVPVGALVDIDNQLGDTVAAEVIGFQDQLTLLFPLREMTGIQRGNRVRLRRSRPWLRVGPSLLGRVIDAQGRVIDGRDQPPLIDCVPQQRSAPGAMERTPIDTPMVTGVRAVDGLLTCGRGQRIGILAGAGVGKSVLLGMMARHSTADVNVIALVGERGREVNEFIQRDLGPEGLRRSVLVVATSDQPAPLRRQAAFTATAIAEYFRDRRNDVLLVMDGLTRVAMAQREIGLAAGELPATRGYPPSVFATLPRLIERAGRTRQGSITALYSVLVEGDDPHEPISDAVLGLLDGHIRLSRELASAGHYPAIDVLRSISRLMPSVAPPETLRAAGQLRRLLAALDDHRELISAGAYRAGSNPTVDEALARREAIHRYLRQSSQITTSLQTARDDLSALLAPLPCEDPPARSPAEIPVRVP